MKKALLTSLAAVLTLGACANPGPSTAFAVDDVVVSTQQLEQLNKDCRPVMNSADRMSSMQAVREMALYGAIGKRLTAKHGFSFSDAQAEEILVRTEMTAPLRAPGCDVAARDLGRMLLSLGKLGEKKGIASVKELDITVNPRFGSWNKTELELDHGTDPLSRPAPITTDSGR